MPVEFEVALKINSRVVEFNDKVYFLALKLAVFGFFDRSTSMKHLYEEFCFLIVFIQLDAA